MTKFANIPTKLIKTTKDGKKISLTVATDDGFYNVYLSVDKAYRLIDTIQGEIDDIGKVEMSKNE